MVLLQTGDLVKDWRRMNVPFTRARCNLANFVHNASSLFSQLMEGKVWILHLPPEAGAAHRNAFVESNDSMDVDKDAPWLSCRPTVHKPLKRLAEDDEGEVEFRGKENISLRARNKLKTGGTSRSVAGILTGRPILQDLVNEET